MKKAAASIRSHGRALLETWRTAALCLLLAAATLAAYGSFAGFEFVNWDDPVYVSENLHVRSGVTLESLRWALTSTDCFNWHPLTWLSHMGDVELYGLAPVGHHRTSLGLHVLATLLLFLAFRRMTGAAWRSAFLAGLFALHPLHVESVAWIAERKDVLSAVFFVGSLYLYARYAERPSVPRYALVFAAFALGLAAKPMLVTLPAVLLLLDVWPLGRLRVAPLDRPELESRVIEKLPLLALSIAACAITLYAQRGAIVMASRYSLSDRLGNALVSYVRYLVGAVYPADLSVSYVHPASWAPSVIVGCALLIALLTAATLHLRTTRPWLSVGWLWFLGMLVPVIGVIQVGEQSMADRYMYLPSIGLFALVAWGVPAALPEFPGRARVLATAAAAVLLLCGLLTHAQVQYWRDSAALWEHAREVEPQNPVALEMLGLLAQREDRFPEALDFYQRSIALDPSRQNPRYNLGNLLVWVGRPAEALAPLQEAIRLRPDFADAYESLGHAYGDLGESDLSVQAYQRAAELDPSVAKWQFRLGMALLATGRPREALGPLNEAVRRQPDFPLALAGLASAYAAVGDRPAALDAIERALRVARAQGDANFALELENSLAPLRDEMSR